MWSVPALVCLLLSVGLAIAVVVVFARALHERYMSNKISQNDEDDYKQPKSELIAPKLLGERSGPTAQLGVVVPVVGDGYAEMALVLLRLLEKDDDIRVEVYCDHVSDSFLTQFRETGATVVCCADKTYTKYGLGILALRETTLDQVMLLDADMVVYGEVSRNTFAELKQHGLIVFESQHDPASCVTLVDRACLGDDFYSDYTEHHERIARHTVFHRLGGHVVSSGDEAGQGGHHNTDVFHYRGLDLLHRHRQRWPLVECAGSWDHYTTHKPDGEEETVKFAHVFGKLDDQVMTVLRDIRART